MKVVLQRVKSARVFVENRKIAEISKGIVIFAGIGKGDSEKDLQKIATKCLNMRIFEDERGVCALSSLDIQAEVLAVPNFTVLARTKKGTRPSFDPAEAPDKARVLFDRFVEILKNSGLTIESGVFGAIMEVEVLNDGPYSLIIET